jgi:predicted glycosyltransferase
VANDFNQTQHIVKKYNIQGIISDNRFGVRHSNIPSVIISHQLSPVFKFFGPFIRIENRRRINKFHRVWIPDFSGDENLSGTLSKPDKIRIPVSYIGILSRFSYSSNVIRDTLLIVLSGPEPQRTHLEETMIDYILEHGKSHQRIVVIRGFSSTNLPDLPNNILVYSHLPTNLFESELNRAQVTISRSGYSSIMDYVQCRTKAVLIPTPGQSEQEYLAHRLNEKFGFIACLNARYIYKDINRAKELSEHVFTSPNSEFLNQSIQDFLTDLA